jgi:hypothetical protein
VPNPNPVIWNRSRPSGETENRSTATCPSCSRKRLKLMSPFLPGNVAQAGLATVRVTSAVASANRPWNLTANLLLE